ncbi:hypothetical protein BOO86_09835 [Mycobacterium sp. CBMA 234]|uniref:hypothetical protein n=1 Tax=Mycolicibacterium sp. CBMA 234 TaxID=1918495 RepID=UPI0012DE35B1|nr:hypothetical protein [Mycolicibacterium sp. CBMA 234]MUL64761.1 hypothetical protein [Mycolicibacterium sp. CBMA 234]
MQLTMKPYITAGVALAGASVIAVAPVTAVTPHTQMNLPAVSSVHVPDMQLTALVNPIVALGNIYNSVAQVVGQTSYMVETTVNPLVRQVVLDANYGVQQGMQLIGNITGATFTLGGSLPGTLTNVLGNLGTLNVNGAIDALVGGLLPGGLQLITGLNGPLQNILQQPLAVGEALVPAVLDSVTALVAGLAISTVGIGCGACTGTTPLVQQVVNSVTGIVKSVLTLNPGAIYNGLLNNVVDLVKNVQANVTNLETGTIPYIVNRIISALNVNPNAPGGVTVPAAAVAATAAVKELAAAPEKAKTAATTESSTTESSSTTAAADPKPLAAKKGAEVKATAATGSSTSAEGTSSSTSSTDSTSTSKGATKTGTDAKGADATGTAKGADATGTAKGADATGTAKGADTAGTAKGTDTKGADTKGADAKGADATGTAKGAGATGTAKGADSGTDKATTSKDSAPKTKKAQNPAAKVSKAISDAVKGATTGKSGKSGDSK